MNKVAGRCEEIGLVQYPDCQLSAIYGLTDLFRIANDIARTAAVSGLEIRVTHWRQEEADIVCTFDTRPGQAHALTHGITPPSLVVPDRMQKMTAIAQAQRLGISRGSISYFPRPVPTSLKGAAPAGVASSQEIRVRSKLKTRRPIDGAKMFRCVCRQALTPALPEQGGVPSRARLRIAFPLPFARGRTRGRSASILRSSDNRAV
jgi:hypothetical protein